MAMVLLAAAAGCHSRKDAPATAFYYWKTVFEPDSVQQILLQQAAGQRLYLRLFDVDWNAERKQAMPNAIVHFVQPAVHLHITPVVFITNRTLENLPATGIDSLARQTDTLIRQIAARANLNYTAIQIDCDWTLTTRDKYFQYLRTLRQHSGKLLQTTIRLHQIKYKERTGVPPVDKGVLMFYNMGHLNARVQSPSSIYNKADAAKYVTSLPRYPLPLDVALPVFSWVVHTRSGKVIQLYSNIRRTQLENRQRFEPLGKHAFRARNSFFMAGVYIKENDILKAEETGREIAEKAARQLAAYLPPLQSRTIIYYELSTLDPEEYQVEDILDLTDHF